MYWASGGQTKGSLDAERQVFVPIPPCSNDITHKTSKMVVLRINLQMHPYALQNTGIST
jgi:hypothetical protein